MQLTLAWMTFTPSFLFLFFFYSSQHVSHPLLIVHFCTETGGLSQLCPILLNSRCEIALFMSASGSPLSSQILKLAAGLCIFVCAAQCTGRVIFDVVLPHPTTVYQLLLEENGSHVAFSAFYSVVLPLGLFLKSSIDSGLNKYTTPMAL